MAVSSQSVKKTVADVSSKSPSPFAPMNRFHLEHQSFLALSPVHHFLAFRLNFTLPMQKSELFELTLCIYVHIYMLG